MRTLVLWDITADVWQVGKTKHEDTIGLGRKILLAAPTTATAEEVLALTSEALTFNWSQKPHQVEVLSIVKTKTAVVVP